MSKFIERKKLGKKAKRALDASRRKTWDISPVTRTAPDKKKYDRKKFSIAREDESGFFIAQKKHPT